MVYNKIVLLSALVFSSALVDAKQSVVLMSLESVFAEIKKGNVVAIRNWVKTKPDAQGRNEKRQSLLAVAVIHGDLAIVRSLLKTNVSINAVDDEGKTALDWAVEYGYTDIALELAVKKAKVSSLENENFLKVLLRQRAAYWFSISDIVRQIASSIGMIIGGTFLIGLDMDSYAVVTGCFLAGAILLIPVGVINLGLSVSNIAWYVRSNRDYILRPCDMDMQDRYLQEQNT